MHLLKVDCEGGEYDILEGVPDEILGRIQNIVFEWHRVHDFETRLEAVLRRLYKARYSRLPRRSDHLCRAHVNVFSPGFSQRDRAPEMI